MKTIQKEQLETGVEMPLWARNLGSIIQPFAPPSVEWEHVSDAADSHTLLDILKQYDSNDILAVPQLCRAGMSASPLYGFLNGFQSYHIFARKGAQKQKHSTRDEWRKMALASTLKKAAYKSLEQPREDY